MVSALHGERHRRALVGLRYPQITIRNVTLDDKGKLMVDLNGVEGLVVDRRRSSLNVFIDNSAGFYNSRSLPGICDGNIPPDDDIGLETNIALDP